MAFAGCFALNGRRERSAPHLACAANCRVFFCSAVAAVSSRLGQLEIDLLRSVLIVDRGREPGRVKVRVLFRDQGWTQVRQRLALFVPFGQWCRRIDANCILPRRQVHGIRPVGFNPTAQRSALLWQEIDKATRYRFVLIADRAAHGFCARLAAATRKENNRKRRKR